MKIIIIIILKTYYNDKKNFIFLNKRGGAQNHLIFTWHNFKTVYANQNQEIRDET